LSDGSILRSYVDVFFKEQSCPVQISVYESGDSFLKDWNNSKIQNAKIIFLDIYMPGTDGIEVAKIIRETDKDEEITIIFTTNSTDHGLDGYAVQAFQYLVKPLNYQQVERVLKKCVKLYGDSLRFIEVLSDRLKVRIYCRDIMYIEIFKNMALIHTETKTIKSYLTLSELQKQLESRNFLRANRSYIVNMRCIEYTENDSFILKNGAKIPISKNERQAIKKAHRDYLFALRREE